MDAVLVQSKESYIQAEVVIDDKRYQSAIEKWLNILAGYNPPWVPGFWARNEVLIQVNPDSRRNIHEIS